MQDFLHSKTSFAANTLLFQAIHSDHSGDTDTALQAATRAEKMYLHNGNYAGALRSQFEQVYALRRQSQSTQCLQLASKVAELASKLHYRWIEIQTIIEQSSCEGMRDNADAAWALAGAATGKSVAAKYRILLLRALALRGNLDMVEGRSDASWVNNEEGLQQFWQDNFPDERAFQFYYNLQVDAEKNGSIYLALTLQRETLNMIAGLARFDFEAMAHFRMASAAQTAGDPATAQREIALYKDLIAKLPAPNEKALKARALYEAYCEVGLGHLAVQAGNKEEAKQHLDKAAPIASQTENFILRLEFLKTLADLDQISKNIPDEQKHLTEITSIADEGFRSLKSVTDRWRWKRGVEDAYRRLLEIQVSSPHSSNRAFGYWELYRQLESSPTLPSMPALANVETNVEKDIAKLRETSLVSFAVLPNSVFAWVADDEGIQEFRLPVSPTQLKNEAHRFYSLCSDPHSSIEKVNASGLRLYEWLIGPVQGALANDREILIEPDSFLGQVPWAALRTPEGFYLGSKRRMAIGPGLFSRSIIGSAKQKAIVKNVTIAIPNSLTLNGQTYLKPVQADDEAAELARLYAGTKALRGGDVTVASIAKELPNADIFEFAGHAVTREHGGELVVQGQGEAEIMSGAGLAKLHLQGTRLVVLSACSTGSGYDADRDPNGLVRALLNAGADNVIATRWDVDSHSTADVMRLFYRSLSKGMTGAQALQASRKNFPAEDKIAHPYYWAGIELFSSN